MSYDAVLVLSFGGPEGPDDVMPFLRNVVGNRVPEERLRKVAAHYDHFGGVSPINERTAELADALRVKLAEDGPALPVYWGNRFWRPLLSDTLERMRDDGVKRAVAFCTTALSSPAGCRNYFDDIVASRAKVEGAPVIDKIRPFALREGYVETCVARLREALSELDGDDPPHVFFSAHSIPSEMAEGCDYEREMQALGVMVAERCGIANWRIVYQSRSGRPGTPWLEPDVCDALEELERGASVIVAPFGFVADHMEVVWDLDEEARAKAEELGLRFVRARTANAHPTFVQLVRDLVAERLEKGPAPCPPDCCS